MENAIDLPSGDQRALRGASTTRVTCVAGPPASTQRTKICDPFGSPSARYMSRLPYGDQRAADPFSWATRPAPPNAAITSATANRLMANLLRLEYCGVRIADCGFDCGFYCGLEAIIRNPIRNPQSEIRNCEIRNFRGPHYN